MQVKQNEIGEWEQKFWGHVQSFQWFKVRLWSSPFVKAILKSFTFKDYSNSLKQLWNAGVLLPLIEGLACNNMEQSSDLDLLLEKLHYKHCLSWKLIINWHILFQFINYG